MPATSDVCRDGARRSSSIVLADEAMTVTGRSGWWRAIGGLISTAVPPRIEVEDVIGGGEVDPRRRP
jgi:hypothetical protein